MYLLRSKLDGSVDRWVEYDQKYEGLSQWIKDMEGKVRNESNLKSDLPSKMQHAEHFSVSNLMFKDSIFAIS